jgi:hypothetical protein
MSEGKLDKTQRLELTRKLFLFRMELAYEAWADAAFLGRLEEDGRWTPEEELWGDYEREIEKQWPAYRDHGLRNYSDGELRTFVDAYWEVAKERMRFEDAMERRSVAPPVLGNVLEDFRLREPLAIPANENRVNAGPGQADLSRISSVADSQNGRAVDELIGDFDARIEALRREGVPSYPPLEGRKPWAETPEPEKLEAIAWESTNIWLRDGSSGEGDAGLDVISVPGAAALAAIERHVEYAGLPPVQREMLEDLRTKLDAGELDGPRPDQKDLAALALARIVGIGEFEEKLGALKADQDRPWAEVPEDMKVSVLVDMAQEAGPPGAYTLAAIEREVDYGKLPPWRRDGLERLRDRLDRGEFDGENPNPSYQGDRAELALRLTELEARVAGDKRVGHEESSEDWHWSWREVPEADKFDLVMGHIRELHLESQAAAYHVLGREVDLKSVRKDQWWEFEDGRREAWPRPAADASAFDRLAADPRRQWYADGHGDGMAAWEDLSVSRQIEFLARYATRHDVSLERFTEAARPILGIEPGQEFPRDSEWQLRRQFRYAHLGYSEDRDVIPPYPALNDRAQSPGDIADRQEEPEPPQPGAEPNNGRYQVWQDRGWPQSWIDQMFGGPSSRFPEDYMHVANVPAASLEEAVALTTDTGHLLKPEVNPLWQPWDRNDGVQALLLPLHARDTDAGDVIVNPQGQAYRVERQGFTEIGAGRQRPPSPSEIADYVTPSTPKLDRERDDGRGR